MNRTWQAILFLLFAGTFLISAPLVVLYTAGYRYEFMGNKIVKTGVLSVSSIPRGAILVVDETEEPTHTPVVVDTILPGTHLVTIKKDGYTTWSKPLEIYSQSTTFAENVVLFYLEDFSFVSEPPSPLPPSPPSTSTLFAGREVKLSTLPDRSVLSFVDASDISTIIAYLPAGTYAFEPSPSDVLLLSDKEQARLIVVNPLDEQPILLNVTGTQMAWQTDRARLLFSDGFDVQTYDVPTHTRETLVRLSQPIVDLAWYPKGEVILYATKTSLIAVELDRRGTQNHVELGQLERIDSLVIDERGEVLTVVGKDKGKEGIFERRLQK